MPIAQKEVDFAASGLFIAPNYISRERCAELLSLITIYREHNSIPSILRRAGNRPLHYSVIDGERIADHFPNVTEIYHEINKFVVELNGSELAPLKDKKVACNINITSKGGSYRWHYDRNAVTAILYLNEVEGGETEFYPNYRLDLGRYRYSVWQRVLDRLLQTTFVRRIFGKLAVVRPQTGTLLVMHGDKCLHSVRPVTGNADRINIIASFDTPGRNYAVAGRLNDYLYSQEASDGKDPNYVSVACKVSKGSIAKKSPY